MEYLRRERIKDEVFKARYFSEEEIRWKRQQMLEQMQNGQVTLEGWLALGDDCTEGAYRLAARLGLPLVRLRDLPPGADATALLRPEVVASFPDGARKVTA